MSGDVIDLALGTGLLKACTAAEVVLTYASPPSSLLSASALRSCARSLDELFAEADTSSPVAGPSKGVALGAGNRSDRSLVGSEEELGRIAKLQDHIPEVCRTVAREEASKQCFLSRRK